MNKRSNKQLESSRFSLKPVARIGLLLSLAFSGLPAHALPTGEQVASGNASFQRDGNTLRIDQFSKNAIVNWQSFGIAAHEAVNLYQPGSGMALFRVLGSDPSLIYGRLTATGTLFLTNPNGVLFGAGSQVDVGSLVATTMRISDQDFLANRFSFFADSNASVVNRGIIRTSDGGYIALLAEQVDNSGSLMANQGSVVLGSAQSAVLDMFGDGLVKVNLSGDALQAVIEQSGNIRVDGGVVQIASSARSAAINVSGVVQANSLVERNGSIRLEGGHNARVAVSGELIARGESENTQGGDIRVSGEQVGLLTGAKLDASGRTGGGEILVGGDYQGNNNTMHNARTTFVATDASIHVDAIDSGNGGKAIIWADDTTRYYGNISAKGGAEGGDGGFVEVSGKRQLDFDGKVNVSAAQGKGGNVLLDPENIILSTSAGALADQPNGTPDIAFADPPAVGTTNVQISGVTGFSELFLQATNDITVANALTMASNNSVRLEANNNLNVNAAITTSGTGSITLKADADNSGTGNLAIGANITSREGGITLSGASITRTAGNIASTGVTNQNAGNISISASGAIDLGAATVTATGGNGTTGNPGAHGGNISISGNGITGTGAITAHGGNGVGTNQAGGNAGTISISNLSSGDISVGALTARTGNATGLGTGGVAGSVSVNNVAASGNVTTGAITTTGRTNGAGGNVTVAAGNTVTTGVITATGGTAAAGNAGNNAGNISINANQGISTGNITASGSAGNGAGQLGGHAGSINLSNQVAGNIVTTNIAALGGNSTAGAGGNAGNISFTANNGNITTGTLSVRTGNSAETQDSGQIGTINLTTTDSGDITTGAITNTGRSGGDGSDVNINAAGNYTSSGSIITSGGTRLLDYAGKHAGNVDIQAGGNIDVRIVTAVGSNATNNDQLGGNAGTISMQAGGDITTNGQALTARNGNGAGTASAGNAAEVTLTATNISTGSITTSGGTNGQAGNITLNASANISTGALASSGGTTATSFAGRDAGNILLDADGSITTTTIAASGSNGIGAGNAGGNAGNIMLSASNDITTTTLAARGGAAAAGADANGGNAGSIDVSTDGNITTGAITVRTGNSTNNGSVNTAGNVALHAASVSTGNITTTGGTNGVGSHIDISSASGALSVGTIVASGGTANTDSNGRHAGNVTLNSADTLNTLAITAVGTNFNGTGTDGGNGGNVDLTGTLITTRSIRTTGGNANGGVSGNAGDITLSGNTLLAANSTMAAMGGNAGTGAGGNVLFNGTLDATGGNFTLTVNSNANTTFNGTVGSVLALGSFTANAGGTTFINGGSVTTTGSQTYNNTVSLGASTAFSTSNASSNLLFPGIVQANGHTLTANAVRDITANNLSNDFATVSVNAGRNVSLRDSNAIDLGSSSVVGTLNVGTSGNITQSGALSVTGTTTLAAGAANNIILNNTGNDFAAVTITNGNQVQLVDQNAMTLNASTVGTLLARTLSGNLTLAGNISASGSGDAIQLVAAQNFINSGNRTLTTPSGRWLVYSSDPSLDTRGANLLSAYNFKQYNASFGDTILGSNNGFIYSIAPTINADLTGTANKTYDGTVDAPIAGLNIANPTGAIDGDVVVLGAITGASYDDKNAGINKPVTATFDIASASNGIRPVYGYQMGTVNSTATGTIGQRSISVITNPGQSKTVGQADPIFTFSVGDMGLATGDSLLDAFAGMLGRDVGETIGLYAINQGSLLATSNYMLSSFSGSDFTITAVPPSPTPGADGNIVPRDLAGLVDANPQLSSYTNPQLFLLNLSPTAAGGEETEGNLAECEIDTKAIEGDQNAAVILSFGMSLPDGVKSSCI